MRRTSDCKTFLENLQLRVSALCIQTLIRYTTLVSLSHGQWRGKVLWKHLICHR
jgi:hypothetical protein